MNLLLVVHACHNQDFVVTKSRAKKVEQYSHFLKSLPIFRVTNIAVVHIYVNFQRQRQADELVYLHMTDTHTDLPKNFAHKNECLRDDFHAGHATLISKRSVSYVAIDLCFIYVGKERNVQGCLEIHLSI